MDRNAEGIVSICEADNLKMKANPFPVGMDENGKIYKKSDHSSTNKRDLHSNRKEFDQEYRINGAIYLCKTSVLTKELTFFHGASYAYLMDPSESIDIDDDYDYKNCELIINNRNSNT